MASVHPSRMHLIKGNPQNTTKSIPSLPNAQSSLQSKTRDPPPHVRQRPPSPRRKHSPNPSRSRSPPPRGVNQSRAPPVAEAGPQSKSRDAPPHIRRRSASPRRRRTPSRSRSRAPRRDDDRRRTREKEHSRERLRGGDRERSSRHGRDDSRGREKGDERRRSRSRVLEDGGAQSRGGENSRARDDKEGHRRSPSPAKGSSSRRKSPEYSEYRRPPPPHMEREGVANVQGQQQPDSMYPNRGNRAPLDAQGGPGGAPGAGYGGGYARGPGGGGGYVGGGADFMESRRQQRENSTVIVWPPSPRASARSPSPSRKSKKKSKRDRSASPSSSEDSSDEDRRRRDRKERKRARKEKDRDGRKERRKHRSRSREPRRRHDDGSEDERDRKGSLRQSEERSRQRSSTRSATKEKSPPRSPSVDDDEWVEKPATAVIPATSVPAGSAVVTAAGDLDDVAMTTSVDAGGEEDSDEEVGPQPLYVVTAGGKKKIDERQYGGALLRGEGSAMAAFLQDGTEARIPRRGEIGLTSDEIERYENVGYVMSGSRHRRMNAVRIRKENQVISAEEKRGILKLQKEEAERREAILREEFSSLVEERLKGETKKK